MTDFANASKLDRFFHKRFTVNDEFESETYEEELRRIWQPDPVSPFQKMVILHFTFAPALAYFLGSIFCYFTVIPFL